MVTNAHHSASPPVVMLLSGDRLSTWSTTTLETVSTIIADRIVMKIAYWPRFWTMSSTSSF
jgi:hypothetical protein